jgi:hypothetical protein
MDRANDGGLVFGIYPGGDNGGDEGLIQGRPADPAAIQQALAHLQGRAPGFVVRVYERFCDASDVSGRPQRTPEAYAQYARDGRRLDLVLMFQSASGDVPGFLEFVRARVREHAPHLYSVQVTEEANFTTGPDVIDGPYPRVREALVRGVQAAREELDRAGESRVLVGFSATPTFGPGAEFWSALGALGGPAFTGALGYVALDFFPDVFRPAAADGQPGDVAGSVLHVLGALREEWLPAAGIGPATPIHVGENGWPTRSDRPYDRQARVVDIVVRTLHRHRARYHVTRYTHFALRDAASDRDSIWHQFGILRDDYTPKPAFETYRRLVQELGSSLEL